MSNEFYVFDYFCFSSSSRGVNRTRIVPIVTKNGSFKKKSASRVQPSCAGSSPKHFYSFQLDHFCINIPNIKVNLQHNKDLSNASLLNTWIIKLNKIIFRKKQVVSQSSSSRSHIFLSAHQMIIFWVLISLKTMKILLHTLTTFSIVFRSFQ